MHDPPNKAPLPTLRNQRPTWAKAARLARDWQLKRLAERLGTLHYRAEFCGGRRMYQRCSALACTATVAGRAEAGGAAQSD